MTSIRTGAVAKAASKSPIELAQANAEAVRQAGDVDDSRARDNLRYSFGGQRVWHRRTSVELEKRPFY